jgi:tripartite-type tricarboxylate transporter receptor subunit TctC
LPHVPTAREIGIKGFDDNVNYMIMVPAATPAEVIARLNKELVKVVSSAEMKKRFAAEGSEVIGNSHEEAVAVQHRQIEEFADLIRSSGIKLQ